MTQSDCLPFELVPHTTRIFQDYLAHRDPIDAFYPRSVDFSAWMKDEAARIRTEPAHRQAIADLLVEQNQDFGASTQTLKNIERLRQGAKAVVTGQQVVLFGGPTLSLFKTITAIQLAAHASANGIECVPIFWLATQDHDFAEVDHIELSAADRRGLHRLQVHADGVQDAPVAARPLQKPSLDDALRYITQHLGEETAALLRECYRAGESLGSGMGRLFARLFAAQGLIVFDPSSPKAARLVAPLLQSAVEHASELTEALLARGKALEKAGYHEQVKVTPSSTVLFIEQEGVRTALRRNNGRFIAGKQTFEKRELLDAIERSPERFSPNVLFRPVLQDSLFPTLAYVGGPAEVAYFAQIQVVYETLQRRTTPIVPRCSATLIETGVARALQKTGIRFEHVLEGVEAVRARTAAAHLPQELQDSFRNASEQLETSLHTITQQLEKLDPTLQQAALRSASKMRYQLQRLQGKAARAELRRSSELERKAEDIYWALYPHQALQERSLGSIGFLAKYGPGLIEVLLQRLKPECKGHQLLYL